MKSAKRVESFRPLSGSYISQLLLFLLQVYPFHVSVPYRGATFLNWYIRRQYEQNRFPSPIGELHFSIIALPIATTAYTTVSVPYRGATFLNTIPATPCPVWDE